MFGILKPSLCSLSENEKKSYNLTYCNLCASLSGSGVGVFNRLFLVNDIVTIDWLLSDANDSCSFSCRNCIKGGIIGKKNKINSSQNFLAAISSYVCGIKIMDNAVDNPNIKNRLLAKLYKPIVNKAKKSLPAARLFKKIDYFLDANLKNEIKNECNIQIACEPTERCYELVMLEIAKTKMAVSLPFECIALLGRYFGRYVYLYDAIKDMDKDIKKKQFNVLGALNNGDGKVQKNEAIRLSIDFLYSMRMEIEKTLSQMPNISIPTKKKLKNIFNNTEKRLIFLVKPLNEPGLIEKVKSFSKQIGCQHSSSQAQDDDESCSPESCCPCCVCCACCEECCSCCPCFDECCSCFEECCPFKG